MAPTKSMLKIAIKHRPNFACIVPEKRKEITTEGGLNIKRRAKFVGKIINQLRKKKIRVSLFIEPRVSDIRLSKQLGANCIELHTGKFCNLLNCNKKAKAEFLSLKKAALYAKKIGLEVHAGHGLTYRSAYKISKIKNISEFNIGHFIIGESIFNGFKATIKKFIRIIR